MRVLDLFSGIGGFSLGLERAGFETVAFCEIEPFCQAVLRKHWPNIPIYDDIRTLTAKRLADDGIGTVDVICGGFPCQPFSSAGARTGIDDDRYLWPEMLRIIQECQPSWVIGENVTHLDRMALEDVLCGLEDSGYEVAPPLEIPACAVGQDHWRPRLWILGHSDQNSKSGRAFHAEASRVPQVQANAQCRGRSLGRHLAGTWWTGELDARDSECEPENTAVGVGADDGLPHRMDRLRGLGNAVHPAIPEIIGKAIMQAEATRHAVTPSPQTTSQASQ